MSSGPGLSLLVPGDPDQLTGGYVYNQRIAAAIRASGREIAVQGLAGAFPETDEVAREAAESAFEALPDGSPVIVDGLALGGLPEQVRRHSRRLRIIALIHHPLADETGLTPEQASSLRESETRALAQVHGVLTTSAFTAMRLADFQVPAARVRVVEPGTEAAPLAAGSRAEPRLLCVAGLVPRKGQDLLIRALAELRNFKWRCDLVGSVARDPVFAGRVNALIEQYGLADSVQLHGEQPATELAAFYHHADIFLLPSHYEGYGMAVTEALARGLPVITTTGGALAFTLPDKAGIKVPPGNVPALTEALRQVLGQPQCLARLRAGAQSVRKGLPDWHEAGARFQVAVDLLLAEAPRPVGNKEQVHE